MIRIDELITKLQDDISLDILNLWLERILTKDDGVFALNIGRYAGDWHCLELDRKAYGEIVLYGTGHDAVINKAVLDLCGIPVSAFCESMPSKTSFQGIPVITREELKNDHPDALTVISSRKYMNEIKEQLLAAGFPEKQLYIPEYGVLYGWSADHYIDVLRPEEEEVIVDAGASDGSTVMQFQRWTHGKYKKIYALEPFEESYRKGREHFGEAERTVWYPYALWDRNTLLHLSAGGDASAVGEDGIAVQGAALDELLGEEKITTIKMDIEGSELKALKGAEKILRRDKPKLMISVYHKEPDLQQITEYLLRIVPEYRFRLRHYSTYWFETVLYAQAEQY